MKRNGCGSGLFVTGCRKEDTIEGGIAEGKLFEQEQVEYTYVPQIYEYNTNCLGLSSIF